ncbi:RecX family transcriptional regulator [Spirosoma sp. KCTC 42546]|uniref:regulatory protein RecX n=1 Tax=Spirosoma sp. KCTC 42546 TaxID=2520506 RepID=UPI001159F7E0|nr:regulatory protein RecX [Spirosoma sp. KCTC 42546]QDK83254.1 RecX family transcriptional regulator [Spirosoma sp. KCTC 42546]
MTDLLKDALRKAAMFCAYQERTQQEVRERLKDWGVLGDDAEEVIAELIQQNYLNEERFAKSFAGGKFRVKGWGRRKIKQHLQQRGISGYNLDQAMKEIAPDDYQATLQELLTKKRQSLRDENPLVIKQKLVRYALSKGYETDLIFTVLGNE